MLSSISMDFVCVRACVCVRVCERACMRACVRVHVRVRVCVFVCMELYLYWELCLFSYFVINLFVY